jgi:hypothetical protein
MDLPISKKYTIFRILNKFPASYSDKPQKKDDFLLAVRAFRFQILNITIIKLHC